MAAPDTNGAARSAVVVTSPPHLTDDGDTEWFIHTGGRPSEGGRRALQVGEHVAPDHPLAVTYPGYFQPSNEPVDAWPVRLLSAEARKRQHAEQMRLASYPCRKVTPACARCGKESEHSVILLDAPQQTDFNSALSALDDSDPASWSERWSIESRFFGLAKAVKDQQDELVRIEAEFRSSHPQCPEGTEPMPDPGKAPKDVPLLYRLPGIRSVR